MHYLFSHPGWHPVHSPRYAPVRQARTSLHPPTCALCRVPRAVGWLLPWALQQLSRGDKHCPGAAAAEQLSGELHSQQVRFMYVLRGRGLRSAAALHNNLPSSSLDMHPRRCASLRRSATRRPSPCRPCPALQHSAWFQDRAARRRRRLHAALMADDHIKVLLMEQQWWAQHDDFEQCCPSCSAAPSDLRPAYDCTGALGVGSGGSKLEARA